MATFLFYIGLVGMFFLALAALSVVFTFVLYVIYRMDGGKMNVKEYFKRML